MNSAAQGDKNKSSEGSTWDTLSEFTRSNADICSESTERNAMNIGISISSVSTAGKNFPYNRQVKIKTMPGPLSENTLKGIAEYILQGKCRSILVLTGAGISTSAGIPDFRSPGTGMYSMFEKVGQCSPDYLFDINYFRTNPKPLYSFGRQLLDTVLTAKPTVSHYFIKLLAKKGLLLRNYTQNVDGLERTVGIDPSLLVEAHGTLRKASCIDCQVEYDANAFYDLVRIDRICKCPECGSLVKPQIILFGEQLPDFFYDNFEVDCKNSDMMIIMGTSMAVYPISLLTQFVSPNIPRLLINRERVGTFKKLEEETSSTFFSDSSGHSDVKVSDLTGNTTSDETGLEQASSGFEAAEIDGENMNLTVVDRDVAYIGNCDDACEELINLLGWRYEFEQIMH